MSAFAGFTCDRRSPAGFHSRRVTDVDLVGPTLDRTGITASLTDEGSKIFAYQGRPLYEAGTALEALAVGDSVSGDVNS
ncbi:hypothetical protein ACFU76_19395 [Streptomyces sp. NPDC057539]|uniref:hypothetical protein n=1 Tax=Streptomyces sp. NPDC057539 TaxID=3346159 RepID=UPI0036C2F59B